MCLAIIILCLANQVEFSGRSFSQIASNGNQVNFHKAFYLLSKARFLKDQSIRFHNNVFNQTNLCRFLLWSVTETQKMGTTFFLFSTWRCRSSTTLTYVNSGWSGTTNLLIAIFPQSLILENFRNCATRELLMTKEKQDWEFTSGAATCKKTLMKTIG